MFKGMRWLKCDLQMQTPGDPYNWLRTCQAYIGKEYSQEKLNESVDLYLKRCHDVGLNVIGVTDHNFIGKEYLKGLIERNKIVANRLGKEPLVIFPGFEVEIAQGLGVHILCLFDCDTPIDAIDEMVTELGLPSRSRVIDNAIRPLEKDFNSVISFVQEQKDFPGVIIAAHPLAESGMLNDSFMSDHFQRSMFTDSRLLAMEVPKPINNLSRNIQKIILSSEDCHQPWKRQKPIATVMSSDCYSLEENDKGFIGKRHSWIQFSNSSIDSLKQAFNDHRSRIRLQDQTPNEGLRYGKIKSLKIDNVAFLENQEINFSPNLNCIIGGRGSGKSSILEYIRLCSNSLSKFNEQMVRIQQTLNTDSVLQLNFVDQNGLNDTFEYSSGETAIPTRTEIRDKDVIFKGLGINIYSQREITQMGQDSPSLMPLINQIAGNELLDEIREEEETKEKIISLIHEELRFGRMKQEKTEMEQELEELKRQWNAFTAVKEFSENKNRVTLSRSFVSKVKSDKDDIIKSLNQVAATVETISKQYESQQLDSQKLIEPEYLKLIKEQFMQALSTLTNDIETSKGKLNESVLDITDNHPSWEILITECEKNEKEFESACRSQGISEEEFELLKDTEQKINRKDQEIAQKDNELILLLEKIKEIGALQDKLIESWKKQHELRQTKVNSLLNLDTIPKVKVAETEIPFLKIDILYMGDKLHFMEIWNDFPHNGRNRLGRSWDVIGEALYNEFIENNTDSSPWDTLQRWLEDENTFPSDLSSLHSDLTSHLNNNYEHWKKLKTTRVHDAINITLYRPDGSIAGSLLDNGLSDGQKNTAILTLLFTQGNGPIVIDQPEDELDSDFIYNELVPIIRTMKVNRQIIIVTHNANLPVNGDAELIYALKTDVGRGKLRTEGGLDNPPVKRAILDIMEGSEEAFKRRSEKYNS
ncbi:TrlF family AAA-like ATPase [Neobacillus sp. KR4-4]|uniref:TrlF family AAA-like ATPase n=1 Tax=Neobacillus sp. KR4-4 TaxID=3344872 RepID=UPI0035CB293F